MWHPESIYDATGHLDEGVLHAWIDGELAADDARAAGGHAGACAACAARVAEARGMVAGSSRILSALDENAGKSVGRFPSAVGRSDITTRRRGWSTRRLSLAAAAALVFVAGTVVARDGWQDGASREAVLAPGTAAAPQHGEAFIATADSSPASASVPASATAAASGRERGAPASSPAPRLSQPRNGVRGDAQSGTHATAPVSPAPPPLPTAQATSSGRMAGKAGGVPGVAGNVSQGTAVPRGGVEGQPARRLQSEPLSAPVRGVAAATTDAAPVAPPAAVPAPPAPAAAASVGAATALRATTGRPSFPGAQDLRVEPVVVTAAEAVPDARPAAGQRVAADRAAAGGTARGQVPSAASAPSALPEAHPNTRARRSMLTGCWRIGASDSTLLIGVSPNLASLVIARGAPLAVRLEAADTVPVVRFWPAAAPVADSTGRIVQRHRLTAVDCP